MNNSISSNIEPRVLILILVAFDKGLINQETLDRILKKYKIAE